MTHWRSLIEREFLGAWDLVGKDGKPRDYTLEISKVVQRKVYSQKVQKDRGKLTIEFKGASKPLICGAVLCGIIEGMYGADYEKWPGKLVTLYQTTTSVGPKKDVPCVRIRPQAPRANAETLTSQPVDPEMRAKQNEAFGR